MFDTLLKRRQTSKALSTLLILFILHMLLKLSTLNTRMSQHVCICTFISLLKYRVIISDLSGRGFKMGIFSKFMIFAIFDFLGDFRWFFLGEGRTLFCQGLDALLAPLPN